MNSTQGRIGNALERIMGFDDSSNSDERERAVMAEAATFGFTLGIYVNLAVALVAAILGALALPLVLLLVTTIPSWATTFYARRQHVDLEEISARGNPFARIGTLLTIFGAFILITAAMAWTVFTGSGILSLPTLDVIGPDATGFWASVVKGAAMGALGGLLLGPVIILVSQRRKARKAAAAHAEDVDE